MNTPKCRSRIGIRHTQGLGPKTMGLASAAVLLTGSMLIAPNALAADQNLDQVTLTWQMNNETGGGAYFGGCNFLSAGAAGNSGSSRLWTTEDGFYSSQEGNVTIVKPDADGNLVQPTWDTKCITANGSAAATGATSTTANRVVFAGGAGTVDLEAKTASVSWNGSYTIVFYGGMTYWTVSDPVLNVAADGTGTLTGTASGYAASMEDTSVWEPITPQNIVLADLEGVTITPEGISVTPKYLGVENGQTNQSKTGDNWGSFPTSFVDFQSRTGQSSYWYSSGGGADPKKPAGPLTIAWTASEDNNGGGEEGTSDTDGDVTVTVPETDNGGGEEPGEFTWTVAGGAPSVNLGTATEQGSNFTATGTLPTVTVTDTRSATPAWSLNGSVSDFSDGTNTFSGKYLGWQPTIGSQNTMNAVAGATVNAGNGQGLSARSTLASAAAGHAKGLAEVSAAVNLQLPVQTKAGNYKAVLTLTAVG